MKNQIVTNIVIGIISGLIVAAIIGIIVMVWRKFSDILKEKILELYKLLIANLLYSVIFLLVIIIVLLTIALIKTYTQKTQSTSNTESEQSAKLENQSIKVTENEQNDPLYWLKKLLEEKKEKYEFLFWFPINDKLKTNKYNSEEWKDFFDNKLEIQKLTKYHILEMEHQTDLNIRRNQPRLPNTFFIQINTDCCEYLEEMLEKPENEQWLSQLKKQIYGVDLTQLL